MKKLLEISAVLLGLLASAGFSHAQIIIPQTISWGPAQDMVGDADVSNPTSLGGVYFDAVDFYDGTQATAGVLTVNGVNFNYLSGGATHTDNKITITNGDDTGDFAADFSTTPPSSVNYSDLVSTGAFGAGGSGTVTLSGLTTGDKYQVESWSYYVGDGTTATTTFSGAIPVTLDNGIGQFSIGTFTATGSSESYTFTSVGNHNFVNDVSVFDVTNAVPEPATWALLLGGALVLMVVVNRRRLSV